MENQTTEKTLKDAGFRVTPARIEVLEFLKKSAKPVGIEVLQEAVPTVNPTTLYRMMTDFEEKGIVESHDLGHGHVDYELTSKPHHHHAVCETCGKVEDVYACVDICALQNAIQTSSKHFAEIKTQNATFFGTCKACSK